MSIAAKKSKIDCITISFSSLFAYRNYDTRRYLRYGTSTFRRDDEKYLKPDNNDTCSHTSNQETHSVHAPNLKKSRGSTAVATVVVS